MSVELLLGDCLTHLKSMPEFSVDSIVTDPPYGLSFMGKRWDYDVPSVEIWTECLRVLKPGGHLLAFAGTRTQHRMAVRIEDAGFEIRDMIAWVYGSGFPKSLDVSKAIDKAAGAERKVVGQKIRGDVEKAKQSGSTYATADANKNNKAIFGYGVENITAPATDAARQWQGWGTALKPAIETVTFASKPYTEKQELDIIRSNLFRLEARLWLLSPVSAAVKSSTSNQNEYGAACAIAQWSAEEITSTRAALCDPMGTSLFELATTTSLSIVSLWRRTLDESWNDGNTSTTETKLSTTIDWRTLKFSLSQITPASIIKACSLPGGFSANASNAENHFNASLSLLQSIRTLSATEPAISQEAENYRGAGVKPNLNPCIMARKPLIGTVAENVLAHGAGAINVDGSRIPIDTDVDDPRLGGAGTWASDKMAKNVYEGGYAGERVASSPLGRWPANLIHDGSDEVLDVFPNAPGQLANVSNTAPSSKTGNVYGKMNRQGELFADKRQDKGSAARFFYCAKASKKERCGSKHPTVKPLALMKYLVRLVTPPNGLILDPFAGTGTTGEAAIAEGFRFVGIEQQPEYYADAQRRLNISP